MRLDYPTDMDQWAPIPKASHGFSAEELRAWALSVGMTIAKHVGLAQPGPDIFKGLYELVPSPEDTDRCLYISSFGIKNALVDFRCSELDQGWRERLIGEWSAGPTPIRPIEIDDIELAPLSEAFRFARVARVDGNLDIILGFAGTHEESLVTVLARCQNPITLAELADAVPVFVSRVSVLAD